MASQRKYGEVIEEGVLERGALSGIVVRAGIAASRRAGRCLLALTLACSLLPARQVAFAESASADVCGEEVQPVSGADVSADASADAGAAAPAESVSGSFQVDAASPLEGLTPDVDYVADEMLVVLSEDMSAAGVEELAESVDASVEGIVRAGDDAAALAADDLSAGDIALFDVSSGSDLADAASDLLASDAVASVQPNYLYDLVDDVSDGDASADPLAASLAETAQFIPSDPAFSVAARCWQYARIGAYSAWTGARANGMTTVAVIDSGINVSHEDLSGVIDSEHAYNTNSKTSGIDAVADTVGHGTHVTGSIAAVANNEFGTAGVSFGARIVPIKCTYAAGSGKDPRKAPTSAIAAGIEYALTLGVSVINMSIGATKSDEALLAAVNKALAANVSLVCAAGNNVGSGPYYPSDYDGVISVTAIDSSDAIASFSGHNEHKTIAAPGVGIYSLSSGGPSSYSTLSGTSMAASIVTGAVALLHVANPNMPSREIEQALYATADDAGDPGRDPYYGWGIMRLDEACLQVTQDPIRGFTDMQSDAWYTKSDGFGWSVSMGYFHGYENTTLFGPYDGLTRGQLATILWRIAGKQIVSSESFDDVDYSLFYGDAIRWARATGVVRGYDGTNLFNPEGLVSRQELVVMLANYARQIAHLDTSSDCKKLDALSDASTVESWARVSFGWCMDEGILAGVEVAPNVREAAPTSSAWRASAACMTTAFVRDVLR